MSSGQILNKQPIVLNNTVISQPRPPTPGIINQPQIVYIRAPTPWGGLTSYNGLQPQGSATKLIRISNGNCIQQRPICITPGTNGPPGTGLANDTKSTPTTTQQSEKTIQYVPSPTSTQQLEKTLQYVPSPTSTIGTNQNAPRLPYNPVRMIACPNPLGLHPQQVIRPIYQTTLCPVSSQPGCQQIRIIQRPAHGIVNPMNVVRTQVIMPHQTRPSSFQPLQGTLRPNSLQTQSQICAWPQPMAPTSHTEAAQSSQPSQILSSSQPSQIVSSSQIPSQSWQPISINATNGIQPWHVNQCMQSQPPPTFQCESVTTDLQSKNMAGLVSQASTLPSPLIAQNLISTTKLIGDEMIRLQEGKLHTMNATSSNSIEENSNMSSVALHNKLFNNSRQISTDQSNSIVPSCVNLPHSFIDSQPVDVEYEKLMASVGIT